MAATNFLTGLLGGIASNLDKRKEQEESELRKKLVDAQLKTLKIQSDLAESSRSARKQLMDMANPPGGAFNAPSTPPPPESRSFSDVISGNQGLALQAGGDFADIAKKSIGGEIAASQKQGGSLLDQLTDPKVQSLFRPPQIETPGAVRPPSLKPTVSINKEGELSLKIGAGGFKVVNTGTENIFLDENTGQELGRTSISRPGIITTVTNPDGSVSQVQIPAALFDAANGQPSTPSLQGLRTKPKRDLLPADANQLKNFVEIDDLTVRTPQGKITQGELLDPDGPFIRVNTEQRTIIGKIQSAQQQVKNLRRLAKPVFSKAKAGVINRAVQAGSDAIKLLSQSDPAIVAYMAQVNATLSNLARTLGGEKGPLTDQDINRLKGILPTLLSIRGLPDTAEVSEFKFDLLDRQIASVFNQALGREVIDTEGLEGDIERVLAESGPGVFDPLLVPAQEAEQSLSDIFQRGFQNVFGGNQ